MSRVVKILVGVLIGALLLTGEAPYARASLISTDQEIQIGREAAHQIEAEFGVVNNPSWNREVTSVGRRIARVSDRPLLPWSFKVLNTNEVNAISLPGGFIYVTKGMMGFVRSEDELAFVLGHEVGHVSRRHHVQLLERDYYFSIVISLVFGGSPDIAQIANFARYLTSQGFSRELEFEADHMGVIYAHKASFNAAAALTFMERLRSAGAGDPSQFEVLFRTHPALADRIVRVRTQIRELGYRISGFRHMARENRPWSQHWKLRLLQAARPAWSPVAAYTGNSTGS